MRFQPIVIAIQDKDTGECGAIIWPVPTSMDHDDRIEFATDIGKRLSTMMIEQHIGPEVMCQKIINVLRTRGPADAMDYIGFDGKPETCMCAEHTEDRAARHPERSTVPYTVEDRDESARN